MGTSNNKNYGTTSFEIKGSSIQSMAAEMRKYFKRKQCGIKAFLVKCCPVDEGSLELLLTIGMEVFSLKKK